MEPNRRTVLVVEDEAHDRLLLQELLSAEGLTLIMAEDGEAALAAVAEGLPDLAIVDLMLPRGIDGFELMRRLKSEPRISHVPIIIVTALNDRESRLQSLDLGADEFLCKPVDRAELLARVRNLLKLKEYQDFLADHNRILEEQVRERTTALSRQKDLYDALSQTNEAIVRASSRDELFAAVCRIAVLHGRFRFAWIGLLDEGDQQVKPVAKYGDDAGFVTLLGISTDESNAAGRGPTGQAFRTGKRVVSNDFLNNPATASWHEIAQRAGVRAFAAFPIRQGGAVVGAISLYAGEPGFFTDDLLATLDEMAIDVSFALDNFEREVERKRAVNALRESESRYRSLFENMLNGYAHCRMIHDDAGRPVDFIYLDVNQSFERLTGLKNVVGKPVSEVIPGIREVSPELLEIYGRVASNGIPETFEIFFKPLGKWLSIVVYGPEKGHFVAVFDDITERKLAEELLARESHRNQVFLRNASDGVHILDVDGNVLEVSDSFCTMLGYSREELIGAKVWLWDARWTPQELKQRLAKRIAMEDRTVIETRHRRRDGSIFDVEVTGQRLELDGKMVLFNSARDITERIRAERELVDSEARFRGLVEQSIAGIYVIQDGKLVYVNPRFAEIFGYASVDELIGTDVLAIVAEKDRSTVTESIRQRIEGEVASAAYAFTGLGKDGSVIDAGVHGARATYRDRPAVIGLIQDISEKKRAEEEIQRYVEQLKTAFMRTVEVATTLSEMRDPYTAGHERRVGEIATAIGAELGLDARRQEGLKVAGYLHDIGKITIPSEILSKPGKLSPLEFQLIQGHPRASYDVLKDVAFPWPVAEFTLQHHERMDGSGYPQGLKGDAILLEARILAVADVVEAMSSHRPYRPGLGIDKALAEIDRGRGTVYDAEVADTCLKLFREKGYAIPA